MINLIRVPRFSLCGLLKSLSINLFADKWIEELTDDTDNYQKTML